MLKLIKEIYRIAFLGLLYTIPLSVVFAVCLPWELRTGLLCLCVSGVLAVVSLVVSTRVWKFWVREGLVKFDDNDEAYIIIAGDRIRLYVKRSEVFDDDTTA